MKTDKPTSTEKVEPFYFTCDKLHMTLLNTSCEDSRKRNEKSVCGIARSTACYKCKDVEQQQQLSRMTPAEYHAKVSAEAAAAPPQKPRAVAPFRPFYNHR